MVFNVSSLHIIIRDDSLCYVKIFLADKRLAEKKNDIGKGDKKAFLQLSSLSDNSHQVTFPHPNGHFEKVPTSKRPEVQTVFDGDCWLL